jgi:hypothetical protein
MAFLTREAVAAVWLVFSNPTGGCDGRLYGFSIPTGGCGSKAWHLGNHTKCLLVQAVGTPLVRHRLRNYRGKR